MSRDEPYLGLQRVLGSNEGLWGHAGAVPGYTTLVLHAPASRTTAFWVGTSDGIDVRWSVESVAERIEG